MNLTVGTAAVEVPYDHRDAQALTIQNLGTGALYLGDSTVTAATGLKLAASEVYTFPRVPGSLFVIADAAGTDVRYLTI